jgi:hypothetical protein
MRPVSRRRLLPLGVTLGTLIAAFIVLRPIVDGAAFVVRAADMHGFARTLAEVGVRAPREREIAIPTSRGPLRARVYEPARASRRTALLTSGLHAAGIDEPRLVRLARDLSGDGLVIVTPVSPELSRFASTPALTGALELAGAWLATEWGLAPDGRIGLMGVSFSGGLSIIAAGRPSLAGHVSSVFALGSHDDLPRVLRYLCTGQEPFPRQQVPVRLKPDPTDDARSGRLQPADVFTRPPHDYGVAVILLGIAERLVPPAQVEPLREGVRKYLWASALKDSGKKDRGTAVI